MKFSFESSKKEIRTNMYLNTEIVEGFAKRAKEDKEDHDVVSSILDDTITKLFENKNIKMANLGAGANPQKYEGILKKLKNGSKIDWVDISPKMLEIAEREVELLDVKMEFIKNDFIGYLNSQEDNSLDCVFMQYAINYIDNLEVFFEILSKKLKTDGAFVANLGTKVLENNNKVSFLVNDEEIIEKTELVEGDHYTINFLNSDGTVSGSTTKYFRSDDEIEFNSKTYNLTPSIEKTEGGDILVVRK